MHEWGCYPADREQEFKEAIEAARTHYSDVLTRGADPDHEPETPDYAFFFHDYRMDGFSVEIDGERHQTFYSSGDSFLSFFPETRHREKTITRIIVARRPAYEDTFPEYVKRIDKHHEIEEFSFSNPRLQGPSTRSSSLDNLDAVSNPPIS